MHVLLHLQSWRAFFIGTLSLSSGFGGSVCALRLANRLPKPRTSASLLSLWFSGLCHRLHGSAIENIHVASSPSGFGGSVCALRLASHLPKARTSASLHLPLVFRALPSAIATERPEPPPPSLSLWFSGLCHRLHGSAIATEKPEPPPPSLCHWQRSASVPLAAVGSGSTGGAPFRFPYRKCMRICFGGGMALCRLRCGATCAASARVFWAAQHKKTPPGAMTAHPGAI